MTQAQFMIFETPTTSAILKVRPAYAPAPDERSDDHPPRDLRPMPDRMNDVEVAFDCDRRDAEDRRHHGGRTGRGVTFRRCRALVGSFRIKGGCRSATDNDEKHIELGADGALVDEEIVGRLRTEVIVRQVDGAG